MAEVSPSQPAAPTVKSLSGFDEGAQLPSGEIVRGSYDENGNLIGWHKEAPAAPAEGSTQNG